MLKQKHKRELAELIPGKKRKIESSKNEKLELKGLVKKRTPIYRMYKGKEYKAALFPGGFIRFKGKRYYSPSSAALQIIDRGAVNGWIFWRIKNIDDDWVSLREFAGK